MKRREEENKLETSKTKSRKGIRKRRENRILRKHMENIGSNTWRRGLGILGGVMMAH